jgi:hypothetical protein
MFVSGLEVKTEIPKPILEPEPKSKNSLPKLESSQSCKKFQGTWCGFLGKRWRRKIRSKESYVLTFLEPSGKYIVARGSCRGTLQLVDVISTPGSSTFTSPGAETSTVDYGIYEWKDDTLRYCVRNGPAGIGLPGMMDASELRPKKFALAM